MQIQLTSDIYNIDSTFANILANQINKEGKIPVINQYPSSDYSIKEETILAYASNAFIDDDMLFVIVEDLLLDKSHRFTPVLNEDETKIIAVKHSSL